MSQFSGRAIWAIPEGKEASIQLHHLPEAVHYEVTDAALGKK